MRSVWDSDTFKSLQDTYRLVVPEDRWSIALAPTSGLVIPFEIRQTAEKGRGVFAASRIPKGSLIWHPVQHAYFQDETSFRRFLSSLTWELACDIIQWAYVEETWEDEYTVAVELDVGSFINHAPSGEANAGYMANSEFVVASRDIEAGEEILQDYTTFDNDEDDRVPWFDEIFVHAYGGEDRIVMDADNPSLRRARA